MSDDQIPAIPTAQPSNPATQSPTSPTPSTGQTTAAAPVNNPTPPTPNASLPATSDSVDKVPFTSQELVEKDVFELMGLTDLTEEEKAPIRENVLATIRDRAISRVADILSEDQLETLKQLLEIQNNEQLQKFFTEQQIDLGKLIFEETLIYKAELAVAARG